MELLHGAPTWSSYMELLHGAPTRGLGVLRVPTLLCDYARALPNPNPNPNPNPDPNPNPNPDPNPNPNYIYLPYYEIEYK